LGERDDEGGGDQEKEEGGIMKYRIWDDLFQRFSTEVRLEPGQDSNDFMYHMFELYTGLKDKNGKEIYEGDIVKFDFYEETGAIGTIKWSGKFCGYVLCGYPLRIHGLTKLEIIGNIHENPELSKGES